MTVTTTSDTYLTRIGTLIRDARRHQGLTQSELADLLGTSQSAVARIEQGKQNLSLEMLARVGEKLDSEFVSLGHSGPQHLRIVGGRKLSGSIPVKTSKNAAVALLCASLLNKGRTTLRSLARIEEVNRIIEVLTSIGVRVRWLPDSNDLEIVPPARLDLASIDIDAARRTRTVIMFLGPLLHELPAFELPYAGGCDLGTRTVEPHLSALKAFGLDVAATHGFYEATVEAGREPTRAIVLTERGDTVTENVLLAAARHPGRTVIRNASPNYMVQDLCFFLQALGVQIEGIGTTTLTVTGVRHIDMDIEYYPSEDPIEAMSLIAAAVVTESTITIERVPIEFLEIELATLEEMGLKFDITRGVPRQERLHPAARPHDPPGPAQGAGRQDRADAVPRPEHRQPAVLRAHRGVRRRHDDDPRLGLREPGHLPHRADQGRRPGAAARPAPGHDHRPDAEVACGRGDVPAGAAPRRRHPARDARGSRHLGAAQRLRHQPWLRGPRRAAQRTRRDHRDLPRHLSL